MIIQSILTSLFRPFFEHGDDGMLIREREKVIMCVWMCVCEHECKREDECRDERERKRECV